MDSLLKRRERALNRAKTLKDTRTSGWDSHWQSISTNLLPRQSRFFTDNRNRGGDRNQSIIDSAGTRALRTLSAGMMAGMTSPARPWFRLTLPDKELAEFHSVKTWLDDSKNILLRIFNKSNTYNTLHSMYRELGGFGTGLSIIQPNFERVIHHNPMTIGEYSLGLNHEGFVDKVAREFVLSAEQAIEWFGYDNVSRSTRTAYDNGEYNRQVEIQHIIEPNADYDPRSAGRTKMKYSSCYWDAKETDSKQMGLLSEGGYKRFRALAPRWDVLWGDTYGSSPGMEALGDLLQLQHQQGKKAKLIDYAVDPPLQVPTALRNQDADLLPGGMTYYDATIAGGGIRTAWDVRLDPSVLLEDIRDVRDRINSAFYADMFLMIAQADKNMTATEVAERHEEKLLMLGPVLERLHNEMLEPLISITFEQALQAGILPELPEELSGQDIQIEFVSMLAQAQKAIEVNSTDRLLGHIGMIAQGSGDASVWDKFNKDASVERYADQLGVSPDVIVSGEQVALVRQQRAQAQQQAEQAAMAEQMAGAAAKLGTVQTGPGMQDNAGSDLINLFSGYGSPSTTELG